MKKQASNTLAADKYVLIVEDSATRATALKNASQERGWNVIVTRDGMEALAMARSKKPAIMVSDIRMTEMDGYALSKALKADPALCDVPVVLLTSLSQSSDIIGAINSRADYYFLKQWDYDTLFAKIASILETYQPLPEQGNDTLTLRHEGQMYAIEANARQPLRLLMSTYEIAVQQSLELAAARDKLRKINESLEETVRERTAQLTASETGYRRLFEAARDGILILNADTGEIIDVNPFMIELLGRSREDFLNRKLWETGLFKDIAASKLHFAELRDKGYLRYEDLPLETRDGRRIKAEFVSHAYEVDGKKVIQCNIRDITERKRAEDDRAQMEAHLAHAQKMEAIGQLAAGIAHEINTPTQYIGDHTRFVKDSFGGLANLLKVYDRVFQEAKAAGATPPESLAAVDAARESADAEYVLDRVPKALEQVLDGVNRVATIVRAMKDFSHPGQAEKTPADLNKCIESTTTVARNEWKYVADLDLDLDRNLPFVNCLPGEINQAVLNIVVNAAHAIGDAQKASGTDGKGKIAIQTRRDGDWAEIRISDTGAGIPEAIQPKIFDPFFTTKEVGRGTGQGLTIAYLAVTKQHGGTISFETEEGKGTTFIIRLPIGTS